MQYNQHVLVVQNLLQKQAIGIRLRALKSLARHTHGTLYTKVLYLLESNYLEGVTVGAYLQAALLFSGGVVGEGHIWKVYSVELTVEDDLVSD